MTYTAWLGAQSALLAQAPAPPPGGGFAGMLFPLILMFAVMYFLLILPNQRRDRKRREMLASLSKGDKVITHGGIRGTIVGLTDTSMVLKVSDDPKVKMEFVRAAVSQVETDSDE